MGRQWLTQQERGSPVLIRLIVWITLTLGRPTGRLLLFPISLYFLLFSRRSRLASNLFLKRVTGRRPGLSQLFRHYYTFAATILDRIYFFSGRRDYFDITIHGEAALFDQLTPGRGCLLLGSHLGSFELLRCLAADHPQIRVKAMMYRENAEKVNAVIGALNPAVSESIIPIGEADSLIQVKEAIERGEIVGILGDRVALDDKQVPCRFFGDEVAFPAGPMLLAGLLQVPVVLFFGIYRGGKRYDIHFELLTAQLPFAREQRQQHISEWTQRYAARLEHYCRLAPYNWFNFYDYWNDLGNETVEKKSR